MDRKHPPQALLHTLHKPTHSLPHLPGAEVGVGVAVMPRQGGLLLLDVRPGGPLREVLGNIGNRTGGGIGGEYGGVEKVERVDCFRGGRDQDGGCVQPSPSSCVFACMAGLRGLRTSRMGRTMSRQLVSTSGAIVCHACCGFGGLSRWRRGVGLRGGGGCGRSILHSSTGFYANEPFKKEIQQQYYTCIYNT